MKTKIRLGRLERRERVILDATFKRMSDEELEAFVALFDKHQDATDTPAWQRYLEVRKQVERGNNEINRSTAVGS